MAREKKKTPARDVTFTGNGGGDYVRLRWEDGDEASWKGDRVYLEVGHQCVVMLRVVVPAEFLTTALLAAATRDPGQIADAEGIRRFLLARDWPEAFNQKLAAEVEAVKWVL